MTALWSSSPVVSPSPSEPVPVVVGDGKVLKTPPASGLRVTWFGHSSMLLEIDGKRILTDPAFGQRASPLSWVGPQRWFAPPIPLDELPPIDAVVISHDHHDHLQFSTIDKIKDWPTTFIVPLGVGAHLEYWGVPAERIVELDWWEQTRIGDLDVNLTPSRHASGRQLLDQNATLWGSYAFVGPQHRVWFSGDTGLFPALKDIGERFGPFDLSMIEVGQYHPTWPDWHIGPEQAVKAHQLLGAKVFLPIHWSLWTLAPHGWTEPGERARVAANAAGIAYVLPKPGQSVEPLTTSTLHEPWWPALAWETATQDPIVSTVDGDPRVRMQ